MCGLSLLSPGAAPLRQMGQEAQVPADAQEHGVGSATGVRGRVPGASGKGGWERVGGGKEPVGDAGNDVKWGSWERPGGRQGRGDGRRTEVSRRRGERTEGST